MKRRQFLQIGGGTAALLTLPTVSMAKKNCLDLIPPGCTDRSYCNSLINGMYHERIIPHDVTNISINTLKPKFASCDLKISMHTDNPHEGFYLVGRKKHIDQMHGAKLKAMSHINELKQQYTTKDFEIAYQFIDSILRKMRDEGYKTWASFDKIKEFHVYDDIHMYRQKRFGWYSWFKTVNKGTCGNSIDCKMDYFRPGITSVQFNTHTDRFASYYKICQPVVELTTILFHLHTGIMAYDDKSTKLFR